MQISFNTYINRVQTFSGRKEIMEKSDRFSDDIISLSKKRKLNFDEVKKVIASYAPDIKVREKSLKDKDGMQMLGMYYPSLSYVNQSQTIQYQDKFMYIVPMKKNIHTKADYIEGLTHEMTHAFQHEDEKYSIQALLNKYYKNAPYEKACYDVDEAYRFWLYFEDTLFEDIKKMYYKGSSVNRNVFPVEIKFVSGELQECIRAKFAKAKKVMPNMNMDFLKDFIVLNLMLEADAYFAQTKALRKYNREPLRREDKLIPDLYRQAAKCLQETDLL